MNARKLSFRLAVVAFVAATASVAAYGCSSDSNQNNPTPTDRDSGLDSTTGTDGGSNPNPDSGSFPDTGSCMSDASTCNSCYSPSQAMMDPLNACAPETVNCIPFTGMVPSHPKL